MIVCSEQRKQKTGTSNSNAIVFFIIYREFCNSKIVAAHFDVHFVFSAPQRLSGLCSVVNVKRKVKAACVKKHAAKFLDCATSVIYEIPMACGTVNEVQTLH